MIKDRGFYRTFMSLSLSLALQNLLTYGLNMLITIMLGRYSQAAMSGVGFCHQIQYLLQMLALGAGEGALVLGAQYWGKKDLDPIPHIIGVALRFGMAVSFLLFLAALFIPQQMLALLCNDPDIIAEGVRYFRISCFSYMFYAATTILIASLRSIGIVKLGYITALSTLCITTSLSWLLINGHWGFPELGVDGAAIAILIARIVELLIVVYYIKYREHTLCLTLKKLLHIDNSYFKDYVRVSLPVLINQGLWGIAQIIQSGILGHLGGDVTAANTIAVQSFQLLSVVTYGAASAASIVVGNTVGGGNRKELHSLVTTLQVLFMVIGVASGLSIFLLRGPILAAFGGNLSAEAYRLSQHFMLIMAVMTVGTGYQMSCDAGIIRGGGDTSFSAKMNLLSTWPIIIPFSAMAAFWWKCSPLVVFFLLKWDQIYKIIPVALRLYSWKWVRPVTRSGDTESIQSTDA